MDRTAEHDPDSKAAALADARRQYASLTTSMTWLLSYAEPYAAVVPPPGASLAQRLTRAAWTLGWSNEGQERLIDFARRFAPLEEEAERAFAAGSADAGLAGQLERASAEALQHYMLVQGQTGRAAELSRTGAEDEDSPARLRARAEIGARVRAGLDAGVSEKLPAVGLELYRVRDFADSASCGALIALIERDLSPSAAPGNGGDPGLRTSTSCNLSPGDAPAAAFEAKVADLLGLNLRFSEVAQGHRYQIGQESEPHHDFFHRGESNYEDAATTGGQRTWTAMLFLNRPDDGGYTNFPAAAVRAAPEQGTLLVWNNMGVDGRPNPNSLHHTLTVEAGLKYVVTKRFRERPLTF
jgi:prolyl 4-hydroxylase